jgi:Mg2+-importing ATPase
MLWLGPISSLFDIATFLVMLYVFKCNDLTNINSQALFHTAWFVESLVTQTLVIHLIRTEKIPFIESNASPPVCYSTVIFMCIGIALPFVKIGRILGMVPLPPTFFTIMLLVVGMYFILAQCVKKLYIKIYKMWL